MKKFLLAVFCSTALTGVCFAWHHHGWGPHPWHHHCHGSSGVRLAADIVGLVGNSVGLLNTVYSPAVVAQPVVVQQPQPVVVQQPQPVVVQQPQPVVVQQQPQPVIVQQPQPVVVQQPVYPTVIYR